MSPSTAQGWVGGTLTFQLLRGLLLLRSSAAAMFGLQLIPVAKFTAITMLSPVLVTLLSALLLREQASTLRWALVLASGVGALIVVRPGSGLFGWAVWFPLLGTLSYAGFQVLTRRLSALESPFATHFYTGLAGSVVMLPMLPLAGPDSGAMWPTITPGELGLLLLIGACGTVGHLLLILAPGLAPTATLIPFIYTQIGLAARFAWVVFGRVPDPWGWVGIAVIATCGAASAWLNAREASARRKPLSALDADPQID